MDRHGANGRVGRVNLAAQTADSLPSGGHSNLYVIPTSFLNPTAEVFHAIGVTSSVSSSWVSPSFTGEASSSGEEAGEGDGEGDGRCVAVCFGVGRAFTAALRLPAE